VTGLLQISQPNGSGHQVDRYSHDLADHEEFVCITLRPLPDSAWLTDDSAFGTTIVSLAHVLPAYPSPITVLGVTMDCHEVPFRVLADKVVVSPCIRREAGHLKIHGKAPKRPVVDRQQPSQGHPSQADGYGFQRASNRLVGVAP
jgi:hypothetical protein